MSVNNMLEVDLVDDQKLENVENFIKNQLKESQEGLDNSEEESPIHWESTFIYDFFEHFQTKFFSRKSISTSSTRLQRVRIELDEREFPLVNYYSSLPKDTSIDDLNFYECKVLLPIITEFKSIIMGSDYVYEEPVKEDVKVVDETNYTDKDTSLTSERLSDYLKKIDEPEEEVKEVYNESEFEKLNIDIRITELLTDCLAKCKDDAMYMYVDTMFNPEKSELDSSNILVNLYQLSKLLDFSNFTFVFKEDKTSVSSDEIMLEHSHWDKYLDNVRNDDYSLIIEKNYRLNFYELFFKTLYDESDKATINESKYKLDMIFNDGVRREEFVIKTFKSYLDNDSIVILTKDMLEYLPVLDTSAKEYLTDKGQLSFEGKIGNNKVYSVDTKDIKFLTHMKKSMFILNKGNEFVINPNKPLVYYNIIDNPLTKKPILKYFTQGGINIAMNKSTVLDANKFIEDGI